MTDTSANSNTTDPEHSTKPIGNQIDSEKPSLLTPLHKFLQPVLKSVVKAFDAILPPYEPRIDIDQKLVKSERAIEHAIIRHFSELQLFFGLLFIALGPLFQVIYNSVYLYFISLLGLILVFSSYELEEIFITSHRIMVRRVGMVERVLRVPSDEEHALEHLVSFNVGRAPPNYLLLLIALPGYFVLFNDQLANFPQLLVILASTVILVFSLRINRRAVTLALAGGLQIILGVRKGIPKRIINALQQSMFEDQTVELAQDVNETSRIEKESD